MSSVAMTSPPVPVFSVVLSASYFLLLILRYTSIIMFKAKNERYAPPAQNMNTSESEMLGGVNVVS